MIKARINKRVFRLNEMIAQINHYMVFSSFVYAKPNNMQNPSSISLQFRSFHTSPLPHIPKVSLTESAHSSSSTPLFASRVPRLSRNEAEGVLFDYLHGTRSYNFTDAEHISKNSPHFVQKLLSKIDSEKGVARSLTKYLSYNPINEFEPFFESLGLHPSQVSSLLPRQLMFLKDDHLMLENFHILCNYGIPRSRIGKIYLEAKEIFGFDCGVLAVKFKAYENLGLSRITVIKLVSCCPPLLIGGVDREFVRLVEKLNGLCIQNDWVGGYLFAKGTYNWNRTVETMTFLDRVGYSEDQLRSLFKTNPALVFEGSGKNVYVLFGRLLKLGLNMNEVYSLFMENPQILSPKCLKNLLHGMGFLFDIRMEMEDIANIVTTHIELMGSCLLKGPKTVCKELKVKRDGLCQIIKEDPLKFFSLASKSKIKLDKLIASRDPRKHAEKAEFLLRLGYVENSEELTKALKQFRGRGDQLQERFDCLVEAGLPHNIASSIIKKAPMVLNQTKDVIEKKIDCLKNYIGYPVESVVACPAYLCYDLKRITHRFIMYAWLRERAVAKPMLSLSTIISCSEARFVKYFVQVDPEGPAMWKSLKTSSSTR
ncbi:mTERF domain-containing protein [Cephalotus follicularis]|uniref:mTERF domain-containing protein n=1 Tax=Cephalotus follicularis TaxID=3775 RepID=A0A1Q3C7I9_CEPFO|nr:mTERF domain-containing protein [Cephalotus follicularis]